MEITIRMKSGSTMAVEAFGRCVRDRDGAGQVFETVEDLTCWWPRKDGKGRRREIPPKLYDTGAAEEAYWDAAEDAARDPY